MPAEGLMATLKVELSSDSKKLMDVLSKGVQVAGSVGGGATKAGEDVVGGIVGGLAPLLKGILSMTGIVGAFFQAVGPIISMVFKLLGAVILLLLMPFLVAFLKILSSALPAALDAITAIADNTKKLVDKIFSGLPGNALGSAAQASVQMVGGAIDLAAQILDYVKTNLPAWLDGLSKLATTFVDWVTTNAPIIFAQVLEVGGKMVTWIIDHLPQIFEVLLTIGAGITLWLIQNLPKILGALYDMGKQLLLFAVANFPVWFVKMIDVGVEILKWIIAHIPDMLSALFQIGSVLLNALRVLITDIFSGIYNAVQSLISSIISSVIGGGSRGSGGGTGGLNDLGITGGLHHDFIWRPGSGIQTFSSNDTIMGVKSGSPSGGGMNVSYSPTYNISGAIDEAGWRKIQQQHDNDLLARLKQYGTGTTRYFNT